VTNLITVDFPNASFQPSRVHEASFYQEKSNHEFASFKFRDHAVEYEQIRPGTPVSFSFNDNLNSQNFYGYVHHITPAISPGINETVVHVIGASYALKAASQKVWTNVTASDVVRDIATTFGFNFLVDDHPRVYDQISQAGHTALELMQKLAHQCGYALRVTGTEIHFHSHTKFLEEKKNEALRFTMRDARSPLGSTIYSFKPLVGETLDQEGDYKSAAAVSGIDAETKSLHQITNQIKLKSIRQKQESPFFDRFLDVTAPNYKIAEYEAKAHDERTRFAYRAKVEVLGHPGLAPNLPVYLEGLGKEYSGYWVILKAEHKIVSDAYNLHKYTTMLEVGLDSLGQGASTPNGDSYGQPLLAPARTITPNVRQTNKKPVTTLKKAINHPVSAPIGFGNVKNKPTTVVAKKSMAAAAWVGQTGNMKKTVAEPRTPTVVANKTRGKLGL